MKFLGVILALIFVVLLPAVSGGCATEQPLVPLQRPSQIQATIAQNGENYREVYYRGFYQESIIFTIESRAFTLMEKAEKLLALEYERHFEVMRDDMVRARAQELGRPLSFDELIHVYGEAKMEWIYHSDLPDSEREALQLYRRTDIDKDFHINVEEAERMLQEFRSDILDSIDRINSGLLKPTASAVGFYF